jgi:hypothetical protein
VILARDPTMILASDPTLFTVGEGGIVFYAEQYLEIRRYVYIISLSRNLLSLIVGSWQNIVSYISSFCYMVSLD